MPRFFIDIHDGANHVRDDVGFELPNPDSARTNLVRIMTRIAQGFEPEIGRQDFLAVVRDEERRVVYRAHLTLDIEPVDAP